MASAIDSLGRTNFAPERRGFPHLHSRSILNVAMSQVTRILGAIEQGDPHAAEQLLPLVYDELRKLAAVRMDQEPADHMLQATALVHEAYIRLVDVEAAQHWNSRGHFFAAAAEAMRRILVEQARRDRSLKGGGKRRRESLPEIPDREHHPLWDVIDLDEALSALEAAEPQKADLIKLRFFAGLTIDDAAESLGISRATAKRHWVYARAWLYGRITGGSDPTDSRVVEQNS